MGNDYCLLKLIFLKEIDQPILKLMLFILSGIFIGVLVNFIITWVKLKER